jgi:hypothetical protein
MAARICLLCQEPCDDFTKAHILPIGFFKVLPKKGRVDTVTFSGKKGRRLQKALYDSELLCSRCEHEIMEPLDDYAIKVIRDKCGAFRVPPTDGSPTAFWIFEEINKREIQAFIASVLWRASVSRQLEMKDVSLGAYYEEKIRLDLLEGGHFGYIDAVVFYLTDPMHCAFLMPYKQEILPLVTTRDKGPVEGWVLQFPNISIRVSVDEQPHPLRMYLRLDPLVSRRPGDLLVSTSLRPDADGYAFMAIEAQKQDKILTSIIEAAKKHYCS